MSYTTNIQWKGTDLCMDFVCPDCDGQSHFDGMFANAIQCPHCPAVWSLATDIPVTRGLAYPGWTPIAGHPGLHEWGVTA